VVFIGYERGAKAWRFFDPASRRAVVSRDAIFNESASWTWENKGDVASEKLDFEFHMMGFKAE
jgi:hypothetical protein